MSIAPAWEPITELPKDSVPARPSSSSWVGTAGADASLLRNSRAIGGVVVKELWRRKDFYVLFILTALITGVLGSANFFGEAKIFRYLKEICLFLIWVSSLVIAVTTAARQLPAERDSRTIFPLLAKPVTRSHVVVGKFLGCWVACGLALAVFYLFFILLTGAHEHRWPLANYVQAATLHWFMLGIVIALTLLGSIVFSAPSANTTIVVVAVTAILLLARHLNKLALQLSEPAQTLVYGLYFVLPHLELFDLRDLLIHNWTSVPWLVWTGALGYAAVYVSIFLGAACVLFRRKRLS